MQLRSWAAAVYMPHGANGVASGCDGDRCHEVAADDPGNVWEPMCNLDGRGEGPPPKIASLLVPTRSRATCTIAEITKDLLRLSGEMRKKKLTFSKEGWNELTRLHARVLANMQLSLNVLVSEDVDSARQLVAEKEFMRTLEEQSHDAHLARLGPLHPPTHAHARREPTVFTTLHAERCYEVHEGSRPGCSRDRTRAQQKTSLPPMRVWTHLSQQPG